MLHASQIVQQWEAMSLERLRAAKALLDAGFYRDSISRSYYAAYCAATSWVIGRGNTFAGGRNNPSHEQLPELLANTLGLELSDRRKAKRLLRNLRRAREDAEYRPHAFVDRVTAQDAIYSATALLEILEMQE